MDVGEFLELRPHNATPKLQMSPIIEGDTKMPELDRGTKIYAGFLLTLALGALIWWAASYDPRVGQLNELLEKDPLVASYPYPFRVKSLEKGVAAVGAPRSPQVSILRFLAVIRPELSHEDPDAPEVIAAQKAMARVQKHLRKLLLAQPDVKRVRWVFDRDWYANHGIQIQ